MYDNGEIMPFANRMLIDQIREKQDDATEDDYRVGLISEYLETHDEVCVLELWQNALKMGDFSKPTKKDSNDLSTIMQQMSGWEKSKKVKRFAEYGVQKYWFRTGKTWANEVASMGDDGILPM